MCEHHYLMGKPFCKSFEPRVVPTLPGPTTPTFNTIAKSKLISAALPEPICLLRFGES